MVPVTRVLCCYIIFSVFSWGYVVKMLCCIFHLELRWGSKGKMHGMCLVRSRLWMIHSIDTVCLHPELSDELDVSRIWHVRMWIPVLLMAFLGLICSTHFPLPKGANMPSTPIWPRTSASLSCDSPTRPDRKLTCSPLTTWLGHLPLQRTTSPAAQRCCRSETTPWEPGGDG